MLIGISDQMGTRFDRLRYEVFQNLILSPMNTGLLRPAVATVLTVYGIETERGNDGLPGKPGPVATVLTVYGIETFWATIHLTVMLGRVATVLTVYGIETRKFCKTMVILRTLQQSLPFTVLKLLVVTTFLNSELESCNSPYRLRY